MNLLDYKVNLIEYFPHSTDRPNDIWVYLFIVIGKSFRLTSRRTYDANQSHESSFLSIFLFP